MVGNAGLTNSELISEILLRRANLKDYYETSAAPHIILHEISLRRETWKIIMKLVLPFTSLGIWWHNNSLTVLMNSRYDMMWYPHKAVDEKWTSKHNDSCISRLVNLF